MAILRVQGNARGTSKPATTISVTMASTPTSGNVLVAVVVTVSGTAYRTVSSIADGNAKVTWAGQVAKTVEDLDGYYDDVEIWFGVVSAGASTTQTVTLSASAGEGAICDICEYSGILTSGFLDKTKTNSGSGTSSDTGTTDVTTQDAELWIGAIGADCYGSSIAQSNQTNGFALLDGASYSAWPYVSAGYLEKIVSAKNAANSGTTIANSAYWAGCIATFFAAAAAAAGFARPLIFHSHTIRCGKTKKRTIIYSRCKG